MQDKSKGTAAATTASAGVKREFSIRFKADYVSTKGAGEAPAMNILLEPLFSDARLKRQHL